MDTQETKAEWSKEEIDAVGEEILTDYAEAFKELAK